MDADNEEVDPPTIGQQITGTIIEMDDNGALLEIGGKMSGFLPAKEASLIPVKQVNTLFEGKFFHVLCNIKLFRLLKVL